MKMRTAMGTALTGLGMLGVVGIAGCGEDRSAAKSGGNPPVIHVESEDQEMNAAIERARREVDRVVAVLENPPADVVSISVKAPVSDGEQTEHIWLSDVSYNGGRFTGVIDNEPVDVEGVSLGQPWQVARDEVSDWFVLRTDRLEGGYTMRVLRDRMDPADRAQFDEMMGVPFN